MKCGLNNNSLSCTYFGANTENTSMKNGSLNMGAVTPPDRLPNVSIRETVSSYENPKTSLTAGGTSKMTAGKASAGCAFLAMALSVLSLLPFIRKKH